MVTKKTAPIMYNAGFQYQNNLLHSNPQFKYQMQSQNKQYSHGLNSMQGPPTFYNKNPFKPKKHPQDNRKQNQANFGQPTHLSRHGSGHSSGYGSGSY